MEGTIHPVIPGERKEKQVWGREVEMGKWLRKNLEEKRMRGCLGVWGLWLDYQESDGGKQMFSTRGKKTTADKTLKNILFY